MAVRVLMDEHLTRVVELSSTCGYSYAGRGVVFNGCTTAAFNDPKGLVTLMTVNTDADVAEGEQVVARLFLTPEEMADLISAYQTFLADKEAASSAAGDGLGDYDDHPF